MAQTEDRGPSSAAAEDTEATRQMIAQLGGRLADDPDNLDARTLLAALLMSVKRPLAALETCNAAPPTAREHEPLLRLGARAATAAEQPVHALGWLQLLAEKRPDDEQALIAYGDTLALVGDLPASLEAFRRAVALTPRNEAAKLRVAVTEERMAALSRSPARYTAALAAGAAPGSDAAGTYFVTFATADFTERQTFVNRTASVFGGVDGLVPWTPERLAGTKFFARHRDLLSAATGAGYWLWKPYIILDLLERVRDGDWVVYSDVGRTHPYALYHSVESLKGWALAMNGGMLPGVWIPDCGPNARWTKRDCFVRMGCDAPRFWNAPQIQTSFSLWQKNKASLDFVREWLAFCCDRAILSDELDVGGAANLPHFLDHRFDQSVLTNLAILRAVSAYGSPERPVAPAGRLKSLDHVIRLALKGEDGRR
jgi:tetratricopeptide (TPR) repeat protein